jgi:surfeit locus 1 family protein|tara:strand:- start:162 stop:869 length:708 start_codon:yes stop_codon:yes gene_type:complete
MINLTQKPAEKQILSKVIKLFIFLPLMSLCIFLGVWQIERGQEKQNIYNLYLKNISKEPKELYNLHENLSEFTKIKVFGDFVLEKQFLLDNQVYNQKAGYDVITPLEVDDKILLVNRGWVSNNNRQSTPDISIVKTKNPIIGYIYYYKSSYMLSNDIYENKWPLLIQSININKKSSLLNKEILPYVLIMSENQDNAYSLKKIYKKNPQLKHYMYAGQWFIFSILGFIFMIILLRR